MGYRSISASRRVLILIGPPRVRVEKTSHLNIWAEKRGTSRIPKCGFLGKWNVLWCHVLTLKLALKFLDPSRPSPIYLCSPTLAFAVHEPRPCVGGFGHGFMMWLGRFRPCPPPLDICCDAPPQFIDGTFACLSWFHRPSHAHREGLDRAGRGSLCDHPPSSGCWFYTWRTETFVVYGTVC